MSKSDPISRQPPPSPMPALPVFKEAIHRITEFRADTHEVAPATFEAQLHLAADGPEGVVWLQGAGEATSMFIKALEASYGAGMSAAVADALSLHPAPGRALTSREVHFALEAVKTSQQAIAGVDYFTLLQHSARSNGPNFRSAMRDAGIDAAELSPELRQRLDTSLERRFAQASAEGVAPVAPETAKKWLENELFLLTC